MNWKTVAVLVVLLAMAFTFLGWFCGYKDGIKHAIYNSEVRPNSDGTITIILDGEANIYNAE